MVIDHVDESNDEFVIQNTLLNRGGPALRIPRQNRYYADYESMLRCYDENYGDYVYKGENKEYMLLANEKCGTMDSDVWYLLPQAYSISLSE